MNAIRFKESFDTINHEILLFKLESYGVRSVSLEWLRSNFNDHTQCVAIIHQYSNTLAFECGVPQGSILGRFSFYNTSRIFQALLLILYNSCTQMILTVCIFDRKMLLRHFKTKLSIYHHGLQKINCSFILKRLTLCTS